MICPARSGPLGASRCDHRRVNDEATVEVTGHGTATTVPDRVQIALAAVARAAEVGQALEQCEQAMRAMLAAVREQGVASADVRSTHVEVGAGHERGRRTGYRASSGISVTVHDVETAGAVVTAAVEAGGGQPCPRHVAHVVGTRGGLDRGSGRGLGERAGEGAAVRRLVGPGARRRRECPGAPQRSLSPPGSDGRGRRRRTRVVDRARHPLCARLGHRAVAARLTHARLAAARSRDQRRVVGC